MKLYPFLRAVKNRARKGVERKEVAMTVTSETNRKYVQKRTRRAENRARFVGVLYFLGTMALAVLAFLPILEEVGFYDGVLGLTTFWKPFTELNLLLDSATRVEAVINLVVGFLYGLPLVVCVLSVFSSLSKLDNLYMRGNRRIGYNQCYLALDKMSKIFSASYATISVCNIWLIFLVGMKWTNLFYFASAGFLVLHFFCGLIGGTVSRFSTEDGFVETPRKYGLFSVFFRNLLQFAAVTGVLYFFVQVNLIPLVFEYFGEGVLTEVAQMELKEIVLLLGFPIAEVIMLLCTLGILRHACNPTEFHIDGPKAKGRKSVRFASFFLFLFSLAINAFLFYFAEEKSFEVLDKSLLYISAISLGLFIFECLLKKFPLLRKQYKNQEEPAPIPLEELEEKPKCFVPTPAFAATPAPVAATPASTVAPVFEGLGQGGVYIQPDGSRVMVLPIVGNAAMSQPEPQVVKRAPTEREMHVRAVANKWIAAAAERPQEGGFSAAAYVAEKTAAMQQETVAPAPVAVEKEWRVKCPKCDALHRVTKTDRTVTCKICGKKFDVPKWKKA